jgi:hypothetical protein
MPASRKLTRVALGALRQVLTAIHIYAQAQAATTWPRTSSCFRRCPPRTTRQDRSRCWSPPAVCSAVRCHKGSVLHYAPAECAPAQTTTTVDASRVCTTLERSIALSNFVRHSVAWRLMDVVCCAAVMLVALMLHAARRTLACRTAGPSPAGSARGACRSSSASCRARSPSCTGPVAACWEGHRARHVRRQARRGGVPASCHRTRTGRRTARPRACRRAPPTRETAATVCECARARARSPAATLGGWTGVSGRLSP